MHAPWNTNTACSGRMQPCSLNLPKNRDPSPEVRSKPVAQFGARREPFQHLFSRQHRWADFWHHAQNAAAHSDCGLPALGRGAGRSLMQGKGEARRVAHGLPGAQRGGAAEGLVDGPARLCQKAATAG